MIIHCIYDWLFLRINGFIYIEYIIIKQIILLDICILWIDEEICHSEGSFIRTSVFNGFFFPIIGVSTFRENYWNSSDYWIGTLYLDTSLQYFCRNEGVYKLMKDKQGEMIGLKEESINQYKWIHNITKLASRFPSILNLKRLSNQIC